MASKKAGGGGFDTVGAGAPPGSTTGVSRVVSLVPSITEALASVRREAVVGATDWCTHPHDLDDTLEARVRGTKNPDLQAIERLRPDVVIANREENRELDVRRLREAGIDVHVTVIESVPEAVETYEHLFDDVLGWERPAWLAEVRELWCGPLPLVTHRVAIPVWRDPWMVVGGPTFTGDLARRLGWANAYGDRSDRYPKVEPLEIERDAVDLVLLPDEPYVFTADDGPEAFPHTETRLVSGRLLTWYGPSLLDARTLSGQV
ncbi:MAG TPA: helical backbone metal receptor [Nocardioides sp.]|uniref:helical backbone metal receptor n=1 Tax=uncultured Nocardioides sp. TaxID=198441 RepID=UPI00262A17F1|nr:helical backbone metal receptor [uncultured Nocardioides sp.]HRD62561.1 helical backbone metal receptor [Nocardioides sp.]HRI96839.1 helical backbone metal receptor [Nocardioides sp.]HRK46614.1 helical backbone metal receptor [Nocardioides sp.]